MTTDENVTASPTPSRAAARSRRNKRGPDSTERGLRIAIVIVAIGMTLAAGYMLFQAVMQREAAPRSYWEYQMRIWQNTVRNYPQSPVGYENLGYIYFKMGRHRQAVNTLKTAIELDPKRVMAIINMGRAYEAMNQDDMAIRYFLQGAELATVTNKAAPYFELGEIYKENGNNQKAIEYFTLSEKDDGTIWNTHISLAEISEKQGKSDEALLHYRKALNLQTTDSKIEGKIKKLAASAYAKGKEALDRGQNEDAIKYFTAVKNGGIVGDRGAALLQLGLLYNKQKKIKEAEADLLACIQEGGKPDPAILREAHTTLADIYSAKGQLAKARDHRSKAELY